uniref:Sidekick cell adhesion molecule 2 n=1 Tax=Scleropages formosus TaxID=113540 RepID=A0A8C9TXB7_SCLFO
RSSKSRCWGTYYPDLPRTCCCFADDVPPYFKMEPVPTQVHLERNRLVLTCMAEGSWPLEFKWVYNGSELTRFSLEYRYVIPSLDRTHAGFYRCIVRNRIGAIMQRMTEVQVAYMGDFDEGDRSQTVFPGEAAEIPAPHIHSFPRPQITWFRDGRKIPPTNRISITLDNALVILSTMGTDTGRYYAQAVNDKNGENKTSQPITLTVESEYRRVGGPADPIAPVVIIPPKNTSVVAGTAEATMECVANARPLSKLVITWRKDGAALSSGVSDFGRRMIVSSPSVGDSGFYECEAELRGIGVASVSAGAYLHVLEPPQFVKEPEKHITAEMEKVVDLPCQARGVSQPEILWYKDAVPISPVKTPRYRVLVGGSLQINGLLPDDTGMFQCFARNPAGEIQSNTYLAVTNLEAQVAAVWGSLKERHTALVHSHVRTILACPSHLVVRLHRLFFCLLLVTLTRNIYLKVAPSPVSLLGIAPNITSGPSDSTVIDGMPVVLHCETSGAPRYTWEKGGSILNVESTPRLRLDPDGTLHISQTWSGDIGTYTCRVTSVGGNDSHSAFLRVRWESAHTHTNSTLFVSFSFSLAINLTWAAPFDGNSPLIRYILEVSENNAPWTVLLANVEPESTSVTVGGLIPSRSYQFRLCAVNDVGKGQFSRETERLSLPEEPPSAPPQTVIASGRTNQSIMIQWQPPPESHQNGVLQGYIIRYCLAGLPVGYQFKNITNPDQTNLLLEDLIIWTNYEIEVAAYNGAGLGTFSHKVTEWTLQGVPTVPPGNVQAEAVNSTTVRLTWTAPSPQFINGINQGYKLLAWEPGQEDEVTVVTVRPNFQDTVHVGYIIGLKKFMEYFTSVLCFTTPGDGPRSPPQRLRTHEDTPGPVGHLSFTEILDTSLKVSWKEPHEKNGILTGYRISWEEYNRTNTRVTHYLPNLTHEYRVTGLTALTTYTIQVAAMTSKGQGQLSSSTISSGVPPELPGPPTNIAISNISPRSVTLQFKPGYDGKTSISRWMVEAQIGVIGENEDWVMVHQLPNEPDARSLEVPRLNPYTFYRFRMRQVNIVGTSPPSQPSRKIQTLQAPPDVAPGNVTLRTASETSLWLRWVPLPEWEYNGNPELVGYRVQYAQTGSPERVLTHVIPDRLEREFTIEDLEEWTEYEVRVQALNGIGAGPWSQPVHGRTRESVPSCGPSNVSAFATTSSSILVRWVEVPEADRNGLILGYKVVYKEKDSDVPLQFWTVEGNTTHSVQLTGLGKYILYEIQVLAFTRIGDGVPSSPPILERTLDDVPGPPVGILFPEVRTTSVRLIWQSPAQPNGIILAYQITYRLNSTNSNTATVDVLNPSARQYTASGLKPESVYVFRITAQTRKGWGQAAEALVVTTEKRARPQPTSRPVVPQEDVQARSVLLSWEPGSNGLSPVRYYTVQCRELPESNWTVHSASVNHEATSYIVDRLKPFTSYQFRVKAINDIGDSDYSEESEAITTLQDGGCLTSISDPCLTLLLLYPPLPLQPPAEERINGILLGFRVRYRELQYDRLRSYTVRTVNSPAATWAELTTGERDVTFSATATQLDVTWDPPPVEAQNGDIQGYKIYFWEFQLRNETERMRILFLPETGVKLKNLTGYTTYMISVAAFNAAGDGPRSAPTRGRTQQAAPSTPSFIHFSELTTTSVNMSWGEPAHPNGIIEGYRLVYKPCTPVDGVSKVVTVDIKGSAPLWMKIKDLADGVTYNFRIRAKTITYGPEVEANITTGPGEGAPGPPGDPFISRYGSTLTLHWTSGDPGRAPITRYVIEARPSDEGLWDILVKDIPKEVTSYTLDFDMLREGVTYDFRVIGVNDYGYGSPSAPSPSISAQKVAPFYEEWWFLVVIALVGLIFILLLVFILIIRGQSKKYWNQVMKLTHGNTWWLRSDRLPLFDPRSPPRPSPGSLHYSDEDVSTKYNDLVAAESSSLTEKPSEGSDSEYEVEQNRHKTHSFVNHYISDPTYYNSWRRQQKGLSRPQAYGYVEDQGDPEPRGPPPPLPPLPPLVPQAAPTGQPQPQPEPQALAQGSLFRPKGSRTPTPSQQSSNPPSQHSTLYRPPSSLGASTQTPIAGFSSFV